MPHRVFISSPLDLGEYRTRVLNAVVKAELQPVMMEHFAASGAAPPLALCLDKVRQSSVLVVLVAHHYGWVPPTQLDTDYKSITWLECEQAAADGKEILAFLLQPGYPWPDNLKEEYHLLAALKEKTLSQDAIEKVHRNVQGLQRFREWLDSRGIRATFGSPDDLETKVLHALVEWKRSRGRSFRRPQSQSDALTFRNTYRSRLTDLMCLYYKYINTDDRTVVMPDGMPVLAQPELLPDEPCPLSEFETRLVLDRTPLPAPVKSVGSAFFSVLLQNRPENTLFNGLLFRFMGLDAESRLKFRMGYYFDFLNTSEILGYELAVSVMKNTRLRHLIIGGDDPLLEEEIVPLFRRSSLLPARDRTKPTAFDDRCAAFGSCALVVLKRTNHCPEMILNVRSSNLVETAGMLHVIPAGTFQPTMQDDRFLDSEFLLTENLVREFVEELFDDAGISGREARRIVFGSLDDLYGPKGKEFRSRIVHNNRYKLLYLGTVIDPVNLKPEVLTVFLIHEGYMHSVAGRELLPSWETDAGAIDLKEFTKETLDALIASSSLVPTGKAHLMLVRKHFHRLLTELHDV